VELPLAILVHRTNGTEVEDLPDWADRDNLEPEIPGKSEVNNKTLNPTPHVDLTSGVPTETGGAAFNAVVPNPVTCAIPHPITCVPQRKQIFVSQLNSILPSLENELQEYQSHQHEFCYG